MKNIKKLLITRMKKRIQFTEKLKNTEKNYTVPLFYFKKAENLYLKDNENMDLYFKSDIGLFDELKNDQKNNKIFDQFASNSLIKSKSNKGNEKNFIKKKILPPPSSNAIKRLEFPKNENLKHKN